MLKPNLAVSNLRMVKKAVITAAGSGTRLLPATKELPKEMLPLFHRTKTGYPILKPMLQTIYQSLYNFGIRNFCFVVGRNQRAIEDHFAIDLELKRLKIFKKEKMFRDALIEFYHQLRTSKIMYAQQIKQLGFGNAVLEAKNFIGDDSFFLQTGDDLVLSNKSSHYDRLDYSFKEHNADACLLIQKVPDPSSYGVVEIKNIGKDYKVIGIEEKPRRPKSKYAVIGIYVFKPIILDYLRYQKHDKNNEIQLTTAIQNLIQDGHKVLATKMLNDEKRIDIGTPENYAKSIITSFLLTGHHSN